MKNEIDEINEKSDDLVDTSTCINDQNKEIERLSKLNVILASDFKNYKTRMNNQIADIMNSANKDIILDLLTVVDDMERLVKDIKKDNDEDVSQRDAGFEIIYENMLKLLDTEGCVKIDTEETDMFDVNIHDAINTKRRDEMTNDEQMDFKHNSIYKIYSSGWMMNGKLLRPVKVCVVE